MLAEDWCGDAVNTLPLLARLAEGAPSVDLRVAARDDNLDLMDAHLTNGARDRGRTTVDEVVDVVTRAAVRLHAASEPASTPAFSRTAESASPWPGT